MTQELGRLERPTTESFQGKRKLLLVPLIYGLPACPARVPKSCNGTGNRSKHKYRRWSPGLATCATFTTKA